MSPLCDPHGNLLDPARAHSTESPRVLHLARVAARRHLLAPAACGDPDHPAPPRDSDCATLDVADCAAAAACALGYPDADGDGWTVAEAQCFEELPSHVATHPSPREDCDDDDVDRHVWVILDGSPRCLAMFPGGEELDRCSGWYEASSLEMRAECMDAVDLRIVDVFACASCMYETVHAVIGNAGGVDLAAGASLLVDLGSEGIHRLELPAPLPSGDTLPITLPFVHPIEDIILSVDGVPDCTPEDNAGHLAEHSSNTCPR